MLDDARPGGVNRHDVTFRLRRRARKRGALVGTALERLPFERNSPMRMKTAMMVLALAGVTSSMVAHAQQNPPGLPGQPGGPGQGGSAPGAPPLNGVGGGGATGLGGTGGAGGTTGGGIGGEGGLGGGGGGGTVGTTITGTGGSAGSYP
jgi:hypothetical protein